MRDNSSVPKWVYYIYFLNPVTSRENSVYVNTEATEMIFFFISLSLKFHSLGDYLSWFVCNFRSHG